MEIVDTKLSGVKTLIPRRFNDDRGFFSESWNRQVMQDAGFDLDFVQDNHSFSTDAGTVRGLHFQSPPHAQDKLVRCGRGTLFDVAVDIRKGSATFGQWVGEILSFENGKQLLIPTGFLHGFMTLVPDTEIIYKCTDYYAPQCDGAVRWDDADIAIEWPDVAGPVSLSDKDAKAVPFTDFTSPFSYDRSAG